MSGRVAFIGLIFINFVSVLVPRQCVIFVLWGYMYGGKELINTITCSTKKAVHDIVTYLYTCACIFGLLGCRLVALFCLLVVFLSYICVKTWWIVKCLHTFLLQWIIGGHTFLSLRCCILFWPASGSSTELWYAQVVKFLRCDIISSVHNKVYSIGSLQFHMGDVIVIKLVQIWIDVAVWDVVVACSPASLFEFNPCV